MEMVIPWPVESEFENVCISWQHLVMGYITGVKEKGYSSLGTGWMAIPLTKIVTPERKTSLQKQAMNSVSIH